MNNFVWRVEYRKYGVLSNGTAVEVQLIVAPSLQDVARTLVVSPWLDRDSTPMVPDVVTRLGDAVTLSEPEYRSFQQNDL